MSDTPLFASIQETVLLLRRGNFEDARKYFNERVFPTYAEKINTAEYRPFATFFYDLDEHFNNAQARESWVMNTREILSRYDELRTEIEGHSAD